MTMIALAGTCAPVLDRTYACQPATPTPTVSTSAASNFHRVFPAACNLSPPTAVLLPGAFSDPPGSSVQKSQHDGCQSTRSLRNGCHSFVAARPSLNLPNLPESLSD